MPFAQINLLMNLRLQMMILNSKDFKRDLSKNKKIIRNLNQDSIQTKTKKNSLINLKKFSISKIVIIPRMRRPKMNRPIMRRHIMRRHIMRGPIMRGLIMRGPIMRGLIMRGPIMRGRIMRGPIMRGPIMRGPIMRRPIMRRLKMELKNPYQKHYLGKPPKLDKH